MKEDRTFALVVVGSEAQSRGAAASVTTGQIITAILTSTVVNLALIHI